MRRAGCRTTLGVLGDQVWHEKRFLGLRADLTALPPVRRAAIAVEMRPVPAATFRGFHDELGTARGPDYVELLLRVALCEDAVPGLHVAHGPDGRPAYAQWLVGAAEQDRLAAHAPGRYERLADDEVLLEGAYTFDAFRRQGLMADGMWQLLAAAREAGARAALTYVADDNVPSLRGCATAGFRLDHVRVSVRRFGRRRSEPRRADAGAERAWHAAVGTVVR